MKRRFEVPTPEEEAAIQAGIDADPDNPEWTAEDFANARPALEVMDELIPGFAAAHTRRRGPQRAPTKALVSLRLDRDVLQRMRDSGPGWGARANAALRRAFGA